MDNGANPLSGEDALIARYFRPLAAALPGAAQLRDDAAVIFPPQGEELVVTADLLIAGVHFFPDDDPADIAYKALAVNVSDLAGKAARPLAYSLALALPRATPEDWIAAFARGLAQAQEAFGIVLSGGDTAASPGGPAVISVTALGAVPKDSAPRRSGAKPGDGLYVSGTIGDAALGLKVRRGGAAPPGWPIDDEARGYLLGRYLRPEPRLALREALLAHASAAMDVSDGLALDCARLCSASETGGLVEAERVPLSSAAQALVAGDPALLEALLSGGDDYEILAAVPPAHEAAFAQAALAAGVAVARIGSIREGAGVVFRDAEGKALSLSRLGYDHFA